MTHHWDEFSKSLAEHSLPRRESLRLLGAFAVGAVLTPLGLGTARGAIDPCKAFCRCSNRKQQKACLTACRACNSDTGSLCGSCASGYTCTDLSNDVYNCGACNYVCEEPGPYEHGACIGGECVYACADGAVRCFGTCTSLDWDPDNCGECGHICPESAPYCNQGICAACPPGAALCGDQCVDVWSDPNNCGACGNACPESAPYCSQGACTDCGGFGAAICDRVCVNILSDNANCGACGVQCAADEICTFGVCYGTCSGC
jgi:hypothetical protein